MTKQKSKLVVVGVDFQGRTCLCVDPSAARVEYIPMAEEGEFRLESTTQESWEARYQQLPRYPIDHACKLFLSYCLLLGASAEVLDILGAQIEVSEKDRASALKRAPAPKPSRIIWPKR